AGDGADDELRVAGALGVIGFLVQGMTNNLFAVEVTSVMATLVVAGLLTPMTGLSSAVRRVRAPSAQSVGGLG
ncbi:MAG TPA: hypothetical protein VFP22_11805, partial [Candidatus Limnocylindrales bacterium]|nr:hypothetical protein [Candidatus Limnocylindrales bacterium]